MGNDPESAAGEKAGDDRGQVDISGDFGGQGLDQPPAQPSRPFIGVDAQADQLVGIDMAFQADHSDHGSALDGGPEGVVLHARVVEAEPFGQASDPGAVFGSGAAYDHSRPL